MLTELDEADDDDSDVGAARVLPARVEVEESEADDACILGELLLPLLSAMKLAPLLVRICMMFSFCSSFCSTISASGMDAKSMIQSRPMSRRFLLLFVCTLFSLSLLLFWCFVEIVNIYYLVINRVDAELISFLLSNDGI